MKLALLVANRGFFPSSVIEATYNDMHAAAHRAGVELIEIEPGKVKYNAVETTQEGMVYHDFLEAHHGEYAGIDDRHRMQERGHRRRSDRRGRKPCVERDDRRLYAEAEKAGQEDQQHEVLRQNIKGVSAPHKSGGGVHGRHHDRDQGRRRASHHVAGIDPAGVHGIPVLIMADKRDRDQGEHLIKHIERQDVPGKNPPQRRADRRQNPSAASENPG